ncbi:hypothetical protein DIT71_11050 [Marinobacter vulgaris]|uniref:Uncharacterized protein n=1 Tax=Marinobacter vulgaris TaxID=1928331 RepID=A0A2V3ZJZ1_9GAMM|nr:DUF6586 family protein [Marinobacter vulgaris]PXX91035.1 hypothetical protein DIT71_11050 [Marinobacter vulgaris]TSJ69982.1 hypothetical protein FPC41_09455 [Marinobacter vulgaris]
MASPWHSLVSQKIFLARTLLGQLDESDHRPVREALSQGAIELALRARKLILVMIARMYQQKQDQPENLTALTDLLGEDLPEIAQLSRLASEGQSWWNHLEQLERHQGNPPVAKKTVSDENVIAVSADPGPDRSAEALERTLSAMKHFTDTLEERHSEC